MVSYSACKNKAGATLTFGNTGTLLIPKNTIEPY